MQNHIKNNYKYYSKTQIKKQLNISFKNIKRKIIKRLNKVFRTIQKEDNLSLLNMKTAMLLCYILCYN